MGKKRYGVDVRKALSARLCQPSESLRQFLIRSFDSPHQQRARELLSKVSNSLHEMLDNSLALELEQEKPLVAPESPMFNVAEVIDKVSLHLLADAPLCTVMEECEARPRSRDCLCQMKGGDQGCGGPCDDTQRYGTQRQGVSSRASAFIEFNCQLLPSALDAHRAGSSRAIMAPTALQYSCL